MSPGNIQLMKLIDSGLSAKEAAEALGLEVADAELALQSITKPNNIVSVEELVAKFRPEVVNILMNVARHGENESAKVAACKLILQGEGQLPEVNAARVREYIEKSVSISDSYKTKIIDLVPANTSNSTVGTEKKENNEINNYMVGAI